MSARRTLRAPILALGLASALVLAACSGDDDANPAGNPGGGGDASGKLWVLGSTDFTVPNGISILDLAEGETDTVLPLTRGPLDIVLTSRYAWVTLQRSYVVRIDRTTFRMDSVNINPPGDTAETPIRLAADDTQVWVAIDDSSRVIHVDPATATVRRMFKVGSISDNFAALQVHGGAGWALMDNGFSLWKLDPVRDTVVDSVHLGQDPANPDGPRVTGKYGYGGFAIAGGKALVFDDYNHKLLRVDLSGDPRVDSVFKAPWLKEIADRHILAYGESVLFLREDSTTRDWSLRKVSVPTLQVEGNLALPEEPDEFAIRSDGLIALDYGGIGGMGLARAGTLDTLGSILGLFRNSGMAFPPAP